LDIGGQGSVFLGRCESSNAEVVVKRIQSLKQVVIDRELKALKNLSHPNIVKFFDSASNSDFM
jgi:serine/threonine protein kinase